MKKSEHTPTPWHKTALDKIVNSTGTTVIANLNLLEFGTDGNTAIANAAFIARAVNSHDALIQAANHALDALLTGINQQSAIDLLTCALDAARGDA